MTLNLSALIDSPVTLPDGYTQRAATPDDAAAVAHMTTLSYQTRGENETFDADFMTRMWDDPHYDLATSSQVVLNPQGEIIGCAMVWDHYTPSHPWIDCDMVNDDHWQDVRRALIAWGERRSLQAIERCDPEDRFAPATVCRSNTPEQTFMASLGYTAIREFKRMGITFQDAPVAQDLPEGFTLRTFDYPNELEALSAAQDDMWQDHYGYVQHPLSEVVELWRDRIEKNPSFDAKMWYIATDNATGEIAGLVLCNPEDETNPNQGYINIVGVRRAYRKQGLAQAMMTHAFAEFWRRGQKTVCLGVDGSSLTGATRLYERVGMSVMHSYTRLEKELRPGIERIKTEA